MRGARAPATAPIVSIWHSEKARLADFHISATALETTAGMPWPPMSGTGRHSVPTGIDELPVRRLETIRRATLPSAQRTALPVAGCVQRRQHFASETGGLGKDRLDEFRVGLLVTGEGGDLRQTRPSA